MLSYKEVFSEVTQLENFKTLIATYEEVASIRMRKIRSSVIASRDFNLGLATVYQDIKTSYKNEIVNLVRQKRMKSIQNLSLLSRNGKSIAVLISSSSGLYGDIVQKTYQLFRNHLLIQPCEVLIIGKFGRNLFIEEFPQKKFFFYDFYDTQDSAQQVKQIVEELIPYEQIYLFYAQFETLSSQKAIMLDIYGQELSVKSSKEAKNKYLFEPSLKRILEFFESEIFASIVEQTFRESELARFAARMITLDSANENTQLALKKIDLQKRIIMHRMINKKQSDTLNSLMFLKTN